jgi:DNA-binding MarR family transcriptional regulator
MGEYFNHQSKQPSSSIGENLSDLVRHHSSAVLRHAAATAKRMGLEASELAALEHLQATGSVTHKRLGERLFMSPGAITAMIDRLERRGYVERIPNLEDRRSALVRITKKGVEESLTHLWPYIEEMKGVEESFSEEERAVVARFLGAATRATQRAAEGVDE